MMMNMILLPSLYIFCYRSNIGLIHELYRKRFEILSSLLLGQSIRCIGLFY